MRARGPSDGEGSVGGGSGVPSSQTRQRRVQGTDPCLSPFPTADRSRSIFAFIPFPSSFFLFSLICFRVKLCSSFWRAGRLQLISWQQGEVRFKGHPLPTNTTATKILNTASFRKGLGFAPRAWAGFGAGPADYAVVRKIPLASSSHPVTPKLSKQSPSREGETRAGPMSPRMLSQGTPGSSHGGSAEELATILES